MHNGILPKSPSFPDIYKPCNVYKEGQLFLSHSFNMASFGEITTSTIIVVVPKVTNI